MKTVEALYKEIAESKELQNELKAAYNEALGTFLKKYGCGATAEEFSDYMRTQKEGEISDDVVGKVDGGMYQDYLRPPIKPQGVV